MSTIASMQFIILIVSICVSPFIILPFSADILNGGAQFFLFWIMTFILILHSLSLLTTKKEHESHLTILDISIVFFTITIALSHIFSQNNMLTNVFTPYGIGFYSLPVLIYVVTRLIHTPTKHIKLFYLVSLILILVPIFLKIFTASGKTPFTANGGRLQIAKKLPSAPLTTSWQISSSIEGFGGNIITGVGIGNYNAFFSSVKPVRINKSTLWNTHIASAGSLIPHILAEMGMLGLVALCTLLTAYFWLLKKTLELKKSRTTNFLLLGGIYFVLVSIVFPPSIYSLLLFFLLGGLLSNTYGEYLRLNDDTPEGILLPRPLKLILTLGITSIAIFFAYGSSRSLFADYYYSQATKKLTQNNASGVYELQSKAIAQNPYNDQYRRTFSQINLLIAENVVAAKKDNLTKQDTQTATQAINQAITEAKAAVSLNPKKALNWENLGTIYRSIGTVVKDAPAWALASYEEAVRLDPQNPQLYGLLGGVYYEQKKYDIAITYFKKSIALKNDYENGYYNLAWAYFENNQIKEATNTMQLAINLLPKNSPERAKAEKELETFIKP